MIARKTNSQRINCQTMFYNHSKEMSVAVGLAYRRFGLALSHIAQDSRKVKDATALIPIKLHYTLCTNEFPI
jgi:hypothetical protein